MLVAAAKGNAIMVIIHRSAPDEVNGQREKGYTVDMADTRNVIFFFVGSPQPRFRFVDK